jgi:hypothetical protein
MPPITSPVLPGQTVDGVFTNLNVPGVPRLYSFYFDYNTPNLNEGVVFFSPTPGDVILDAWTSTVVEFNGTGLLWDIGTYNQNADEPSQGMMRYWFSNNPVLSDTSSTTTQLDFRQNDSYPNSFSTTAMQYAVDSTGAYPWQTEILTGVPLKFVVSQDGLKGGPPIGGDTGYGILYMLVASPKQLNTQPSLG